MKVHLIYKEDAWHTKGSGKLLRVAITFRNATQQPRLTELRKSNLKICAISGRANVVVKTMSLILKHGR